MCGDGAGVLRTWNISLGVKRGQHLHLYARAGVEFDQGGENAIITISKKNRSGGSGSSGFGAMGPGCSN